MTARLRRIRDKRLGDTARVSADALPVNLLISWQEVYPTRRKEH
jgi:hypothetical protein